jgi:hypothetical protein
MKLESNKRLEGYSYMQLWASVRSTNEIYPKTKYSKLISLTNTTENYAIDHSALNCSLALRDLTGNSYRMLIFFTG